MDLSQFLPALGSNVFIIIAFIVALSVIVAIHEYGHYIVGRWTGIHAEVFSLGFGPVLYKRTDKRGTVWQIAALPFGGYVKFLGDANAASVGGTDSVEGFSSRNTMMGAPLWARFLTVLAGPVFNFILAILIFGGYIMWSGKPSDNAVFQADLPMPATYASDLQAGDVVLRAGDIDLSADAENDSELEVADRIDYVVLRDGVEVTVEGPFLIPPRVDSLMPRSAADEAGLKINDVITEINGMPVFAFQQIVDIVNEGEGDELTVKVWREGDTVDLTMSPRRMDLPTEDGFETRWLIGMTGTYFFEEARLSVGPFEAINLGSKQLWRHITTSLSGLGHIISGDISTCNLSGPVGIAQASGSMAAQGTTSYILFIGMLSAAVGLLNLFPIPVLDGGHIVFHAYEAVTRRKPSDAAVKALMVVGLLLIFSLMAFSLLNDLILCP